MATGVVTVTSVEGQRYEFEASRVSQTALQSMFGTPIAFLVLNNEPVFAEPASGIYRNLMPGATYIVQPVTGSPAAHERERFAAPHRGDLSAHDRDKLLRVFRKFDRDMNGLIDKQEFSQLLKALGSELGRVETERVFDDMDLDGNDEIDFDEFLRWWSTPNKHGSHGIVHSLLNPLRRSVSPQGWAKLS